MGPSWGKVSYCENVWKPRMPQLAIKMSAPKMRMNGPAMESELFRYIMYH